MPARIIAVALAVALAIFGVSRIRKARKAKRADEPMLESNTSTPASERLPTLTPTS
ncbi:MAG: hypothetical protein ACRD2C_03495 [Acidimicrobiales bacterium]